MKKCLAVLLISFWLGSFAQDDRFLPKGEGFEIVRHSHYILGYSELHEQALWVAYELEFDELNGPYERTDNFREDPMVSKGSASLADYRGSGYDRGHLAPAADMGFSETAMSESFFMSNMSPQVPSLNRGAWKKLEEDVRTWTAIVNKVYVVTGPILQSKNDVLATIGENMVSIPKRYYKVIFTEDHSEAIAFVYGNSKEDSNDLKLAAKSVDYVEEVTGLDFFSELPDSSEFLLEEGYDLEFWQQLQRGNDLIDSSSNSERLANSVRCQGIAKSTGVQCKKMTLNANEHCHYHQNQVGLSTEKPKTKTYESERCTATTQAGSRCKRSAASGSTKCWQH